MKRQAERFFLDFRSAAVRAVFHEPSTEAKLRKVFDYFVTTYKSAKMRTRCFFALGSGFWNPSWGFEGRWRPAPGVRGDPRAANRAVVCTGKEQS